jgi:hypothetical protein
LIIDKKLYEIGKRNDELLKYKVNKAQAFVIGGYTPDIRSMR